MSTPPKTQPTLYCSFCYRSQHEVTALVAGPGVYICDACTDMSGAAIKGESLPSFPTLADMDEDALLARLGPAAFAMTVAEKSLRDQVAALRAKGTAWARIGEALGTSRQAAWERFATS